MSTKILIDAFAFSSIVCLVFACLRASYVKWAVEDAKKMEHAPEHKSPVAKYLRWTLLAVTIFAFILETLLVFSPEAQPKDKMTVTKMQVEVTANLNDDGWYWVQFHLPSDGDLQARITEEQYRENMVHDPEGDLNHEITLGELALYSNFCCGQTKPGRYVYLPTYELNKGVTQLIFVGTDQVMVIDIPETLLTPQNGTFIADATKYSYAIAP